MSSSSASSQAASTGAAKSALELLEEDDEFEVSSARMYTSIYEKGIILQYNDLRAPFLFSKLWRAAMGLVVNFYACDSTPYSGIRGC